ncbi:alpha/beta fold hydrolase [Fodinibius halophilus]|uniref:Alpha/beta hydrolase n=1 Tax=Fodinibius halophilus TaxID=1736908 RepID=A0A6M1ST70_9BACT|nr:alpha/beta hydrolase [Fodinibius halophilus]NGP87128.1 alpha/beta hydrolase [Fodinibius halophilus]
MPHLLLLHGALGCKEQFSEIEPALAEYFEIHKLDFEGHGQSGKTESPFRISYFAENVLGYLDEHAIDKANIFGYSMGGYVALYIALTHPDRINKIGTLGTILQWDKEVVKRECRYLYPKKIEEKVPRFADILNQRHPDRWKRVVRRTKEMLEHLGMNPSISSKDWKEIEHTVRLHIGDKDNTADIEKTVEVYKKMPNSQLMVLPKTKHPFEAVNQKVLTTSIIDFFIK